MYLVGNGPLLVDDISLLGAAGEGNRKQQLHTDWMLQYVLYE